MFIISGQVRYDTTARYAMQFTDGLPLRAMGDQEYDIVKSVAPMTKYAVMIEDPKMIRYALEKAWHLATTGRPGPVWIDIPVNFQGGYIETEELEGYDPTEDDAKLPPVVDEQTVRTVLEQFQEAEPGLKNVRQMIEDMAVQMQKISDNFAQADSDMAGQM